MPVSEIQGIDAFTAGQDQDGREGSKPSGGNGVIPQTGVNGEGSFRGVESNCTKGTRADLVSAGTRNSKNYSVSIFSPLDDQVFGGFDIG